VNWVWLVIVAIGSFSAVIGCSSERNIYLLEEFEAVELRTSHGEIRITVTGTYSEETRAGGGLIIKKGSPYQLLVRYSIKDQDLDRIQVYDPVFRGEESGKEIALEDKEARLRSVVSTDNTNRADIVYARLPLEYENQRFRAKVIISSSKGVETKEIEGILFTKFRKVERSVLFDRIFSG
jgi:hypothetical protein